MKTRREIELELRREYLKKQQEASQKADYFILKARTNPEFNSNYIRLNELNYLIAKKNYDKIDCSKEMQEVEKLNKTQTKLLKKLGFEVGAVNLSYLCNNCKDSGFIGDNPCKCFRKELSKRLLKESGVDYSSLKKLEDYDPNICTTKDSKHKEMLVKLKGFIEGFVSSFPKVKKEMIFITGNTGTGKTFASEVIASELIKKCFYVNIVSAFQMNNIFLDYHKDFDKTTTNKLSALLDVDLLVIDDLGTEPTFKNVSVEYLYLILSERLRNHKKTIITTNLNPNEFIDRYGERIYSRVFDKSRSTLISLTGEDLRTDNNKN